MKWWGQIRTGLEVVVRGPFVSSYGGGGRIGGDCWYVGAAGLWHAQGDVEKFSMSGW